MQTEVGFVLHPDILCQSHMNSFKAIEWLHFALDFDIIFFFLMAAICLPDKMQIGNNWQLN